MTSMTQKNLLRLWFISIALIVPQITFAQAPQPTTEGLGKIQTLFGGTVASWRFNTAGELVQYVIRVLLYFSGAVAVIALLIGGYQMLTAGGNPKRYEAGKNTVKYALIGVVLIVLAFVIVTTVVNLVSRRPL
jgi:hypothetical protein